MLCETAITPIEIAILGAKIMQAESPFESSNEQLIHQLQNMLGYLECELLYLRKDIDAMAAELSLENDLPSAKFALAAYCVELASRTVHETSVVDWMNSRLMAMTKVALTTAA
jgi:hypothetical protein